MDVVELGLEGLDLADNFGSLGGGLLCYDDGFGELLLDVAVRDETL